MWRSSPLTSRGLEAASWAYVHVSIAHRPRNPWAFASCSWSLAPVTMDLRIRFARVANVSTSMRRTGDVPLVVEGTSPRAHPSPATEQTPQNGPDDTARYIRDARCNRTDHPPRTHDRTPWIAHQTKFASAACWNARKRQPRNSAHKDIPSRLQASARRASNASH